MNTGVHVSLQISVFHLFGYMSGVELLDHVLDSQFPVLWETSIYFLMYAFPPLRVYKDSFSPSPQFICRLYADRFWKGMRCYLIVVLISISLIIQGYWASCHMPVRYLYVLFGKMSAQVFSPFHGLGSLLLLLLLLFDTELDDLLMYFTYQRL